MMRILIAGLGNISHGDDGFGSAVARQLAALTWPAGVTIGDFGARLYDLQNALQAGHDAAILIDVTRRGGAPGTLSWIDPNVAREPAAPVASDVVTDPHALDETRVAEVVAVVARLPRLLVLGCEPLRVGEDAAGTPMSAEVERALPEAVAMVQAMVADWHEEAGGA